jgi:hypothetical protein
MRNSQNKAKQNFILLMKILVAVFSCWYIFTKIEDEHSGLQTAFAAFSEYDFWAITSIIFTITFLSVLNWFFEIFKWKSLTSQIEILSLQIAAFQTLIAHSVAVFTPNRIGDFGVKILFFEAKHHKRILGLNLLNNLAQMMATIVFGILGFLLLNQATFHSYTALNTNLLLWFVVGTLLLFFVLKPFLVRSFHKFKTHLQLGKKKPLKVFVLSIIRYALFSHQYFILGWALGWNVDYFTAMPIIFVLYFLASFLPSIFILDSAIKAGIGIYIFSTVGVPSLLIVAISSIMWLLNFALPAIIGSALLLQLKLNPLSDRTQIRIY